MSERGRGGGVEVGGGGEKKWSLEWWISKWGKLYRGILELRGG